MSMTVTKALELHMQFSSSQPKRNKHGRNGVRNMTVVKWRKPKQ